MDIVTYVELKGSPNIVPGVDGLMKQRVFSLYFDSRHSWK
jgi:hypothetical protein